MGTPIRYGEKLNLSLQLYDGSTSRRVFVELRDQDGTLSKSAFEIPHIDGGLFLENTETMIYGNRLLAVFTVYMPDGTTIDTNYTKSMDHYYIDSGDGYLPTDLTGSLESQTIFGDVESNDLSATLEGEVIL